MLTRPRWRSILASIGIGCNAHATDLGALRLGGPHGRLRFDIDHALAALHDTRPARTRRHVARRRSHRRDARGLIPYETE
jgi:hypothetical protein